MPRNYIKKGRPDMTGENNPFYGKKHNLETRKVLSELASKKIGKKNPNFKGGYWNKNLPMYDTYAERISFAEEVRRSPENKDLLEVKCTYCDRWFVPKRTDLGERIKVLINGKTRGEGRLYCSEGCKKACPMFLMRKNIRGDKLTTSREVQPELRKLVLKRDNYTCQICGKKEVELHCHHVDPVVNNPIESADVDNCITLCKKCHIHIHKENKDCINRC